MALKVMEATGKKSARADLSSKPVEVNISDITAIAECTGGESSEGGLLAANSKIRTTDSTLRFRTSQIRRKTNLSESW